MTTSKIYTELFDIDVIEIVVNGIFFTLIPQAVAEYIDENEIEDIQFEIDEVTPIPNNIFHSYCEKKIATYLIENDLA